MSFVTDIILVTAIGDGGIDDEHPNTDRLNAWICKAHGPTEALKKVDQHAGGNKVVQCDVFLGAINYLDERGLIQAFRGVQWGLPDCAQLMLKADQEDRFTVYQLDYRGAVSVLNPNDARAMRNVMTDAVDNSYAWVAAVDVLGAAIRARTAVAAARSGEPEAMVRVLRIDHPMEDEVLEFSGVCNYRGALQVHRGHSGDCYWRVDCDVDDDPWIPIPEYLYEVLKRYHSEA